MKIVVDVDPAGGGKVKVGETISDSYPDTHAYTRYTTVSLEAQPETGYSFTNWGGDISSTENPISIDIDVYQQITAYFTSVWHDLDVQVSGQGTLSLPTGIQSYGEGVEVEITATPDSGWRFDGWTGDVSDPAAVTTTVSIDADKAVTANFSQIMHDLDVQVSGQGTTSLPVGIQSYGEGSEVEITATPDSGWRFDGWSGDVSDPAAETVTVIIDKDKAVTASFSQIIHDLTVKVIGHGSTNPPKAVYNYGEGTTVEITATPDDGWQFDGWTGAVADPAAAATTVLIDADKTVTATFSQKTPWGMIIGVIGGALGAGLGTYFGTRRRKAKAAPPPAPTVK